MSQVSEARGSVNEVSKCPKRRSLLKLSHFDYISKKKKQSHLYLDMISSARGGEVFSSEHFTQRVLPAKSQVIESSP